MGQPPLIAISTSELRTAERVRPLPESEPRMRELALGLTYPRAIDRAGAIGVVVPPMLLGIDALLDRVDGLLLSGGPDIHPGAYGESPHPALGETEPDLDKFELELARRADARGMPILALCRGAQVLNVARGGTLIQDLPDAVGDRIEHRQHEPGRVATHTVDVDTGSRLAGLIGAGERAVNSFHHQAVARLGHDLRPVAWAPDGVIEAVEALDRDFVVGVQWHAESLASEPDHGPLFAALVAAANGARDAADARPVARAAGSP